MAELRPFTRVYVKSLLGKIIEILNIEDGAIGYQQEVGLRENVKNLTEALSGYLTQKEADELDRLIKKWYQKSK